MGDAIGFGRPAGQFVCGRGTGHGYDRLEQIAKRTVDGVRGADGWRILFLNDRERPHFQQHIIPLLRLQCDLHAKRQIGHD